MIYEIGVCGLKVSPVLTRKQGHYSELYGHSALSFASCMQRTRLCGRGHNELKGGHEA